MRTLISLGWSPNRALTFFRTLSSLSEEVPMLPQFLFEYGKPQPDLDILEIESVQGLPIAAYSAIVTSLLVHKNNVKGVRLNNLDLTQEIIPVLQFLMNSKEKRIIEITLNSTRIKDEGAYRLLQFSRINSTYSIQIMRLEECDISSQGGIYISALLKEVDYVHTSMRLSVLSLRGNNIGKIGAETIIFALRTNTSLKYLDLSDNRVYNLALNIVFDMLKVNKTLQLLYLHDNR